MTEEEGTKTNLSYWIVVFLLFAGGAGYILPQAGC